MIELRGGPVASAERARLIERVEALGVAPVLSVIAVGDDEASAAYRRTIVKGASAVGIDVRVHELAADAAFDDVAACVHECGADDGVHGIVVQTPLPPHLPLGDVAMLVPAAKDVDGVSPESFGRLAAGLPCHVPATAAAAMRLIAASGVSLAGARAVVVGRSATVGKPVAMLLLAEHATVTVCHSRTVDLADVVRSADVVVVAVGRPRFIDGAAVRPGALVVDVGINVVDDGGIVGDVDAESVAAVAGWLTPVPGGVGPLTNVMLFANVVAAAEAQVSATRVPPA